MPETRSESTARRRLGAVLCAAALCASMIAPLTAAAGKQDENQGRDGAPVAAAQSTRDSATEEVLVTAPRVEALEEFVTEMAAPGSTDQLARWREQLCIAVAGFDTTQAQRLTDHVLSVAEPLDLSQGPSQCVPNLLFILTADADGMAAALAKKHDWALRQESSARLRGFTGSDAAVRWIATIDRCGFGCSLADSRLRKSTAPSLDSMFVIIDATRLAGIGLNSLGDYLAMVALAYPEPQALPTQDSILALFSDAATPQPALTAVDRAYLGGLYHAPTGMSAERQRSAISGYMVRAVASSE